MRVANGTSLRFGLITAAGVLALVACGDSGTDTTGSTSSSGGSGTGASGTGGTTTSQGGGTTTSTGGSGGMIGTGGSGTGGAVACEDTAQANVAGDECDAFAEGYCTQLENCSNFIFRVLAGTKAECVLLLNQQCEHKQGLPGKDDSVAVIEECAEKLVNATCECAGSVCAGLGITDGGTLADGQPCEQADQCASNYCNKGSADCGVCAATVPLNGSCAGSGARCVKGTYCDTGTQVCLTEKATGDTCTYNKQCAGAQNLTEGIACANGQCGPALGLNADCSGANSDSCNLTLGLLCHPISMTCQALVISDVGGPCGYDSVNMTVAGCKGDAVCSANQNGMCLARKTLNQACTLKANGDPDDAGDHNCLPHLSCVSSVCVATPDFTCP